MLRMIDLGWAAGFLEGEGWFGGGQGYCSITMGAGQKEREPLERLQKLFGGKIILRKGNGFNRSEIWWWTLNSLESPGVMMTLYSLMSGRRQKTIREALAVWKTKRRMRQDGAAICVNGHEITGHNAMQIPGRKYPLCRICKNEVRQRWRQRGRVAGPRCIAVLDETALWP